MKTGLSRTTSALSDNLTGIFTKRSLDAETIAELEEALIRADMGAALAHELADAVAKGRYDKEISEREIRAALAGGSDRGAATGSQSRSPIDRAKKPFVILVAGVNGTGKTTTIGKLAAQLGKAG